MLNYEFNSPRRIISGDKALCKLGYEMANLGVRKPILITLDKVMEQPFVRAALDELAGWGISLVAVVTDIPPESSLEIVNSICRAFAEKGCDSIIAVGGGTVIDTAKAVSIAASSDCDISILKGYEKVIKRRVPLISIPTTSGTGAEASYVSVISDSKNDSKVEFMSYHMIPDVVILDPRLLILLPQRFTAASAIDVISHAIGAYESRQKNPLSDSHAFTAIRLVIENIDNVFKEGSEVETRLALANAAFIAGTAFSNSMVGVSHAIGHAIGGICHCPHGEIITCLLTNSMEFNFDRSGGLYGELLLAISGAEIYASLPSEQRGRETIRVLEGIIDKLKVKTGIPKKLGELGVNREDYPRIAKMALLDGAIIVNPKHVTYDDIISILDKSQ